MTDPRTSDELATPKTDAAAYYVSAVNIDDEVVSADFARAQECDLAKLRAAIEEIGQHALPTTRARLQRALAGADWRQP